MTDPADSNFPPPPLPKGPALWEDFVDIFTSPTEVFERRRNSGFAGPLLFYAVLTAAILLAGKSAMQPMFDAEYSRRVADAVKSNPGAGAQMESMRATIDKFAMLGLAIAPFLTPIVVGLIVWIAGKCVSAKETVSQACLIASYALIPRILDSAIRVGQAFFMDPASLNGLYRVTLSPARFLDPDTSSAGLIALLSTLDVFMIWSTILIAIGYLVVAKVPRQRAYLGAFIVFIIVNLPSLVTALRS